MVHSSSGHELEQVISKYGLARRSAHNVLQGHPWDKVTQMMVDSWSPENPEGCVFLNVAENPLQRHEVASYIRDNLRIDPIGHLGYGQGPRGSPRLKKALASFFNSDFCAYQPVKETDVLVLPGVMAVLDALSWSICNDGEGIIVPMPFYTGFTPAIRDRSGVVIIPAAFQPITEYQNLDDVFDPEMNKQALENALQKAVCDGVKVKAVMISNPHNPLGRCYPSETLRQIARFCGANDLHLISDEIFAKSVYQNVQAPHDLPSFTSVLSLDLGDCIGRHLVHVAYGMGKDFCASGLRLGALVSRSEGLVAAVTSLCVFGWVPYITQEIWASMLENRSFLATFTAKNNKHLATHCAIIGSFLEKHKIPYYSNINAGTFVWVDLRRYLHDQDKQDEALDLSITSLSLPDMELYRNRQTELLMRCLNHGVGISLGSSFSAEELGWFRICFTVEKQALYIGLKRLIECLDAIVLDGWK